MATVPHNSAADRALDAITGRASATARTTYLVLLTAAPTRNSTTLANMAEVTTPGSNGYNRLAVTWTAPSGTTTRTTSNSTELLWNQFTADLGAISHVALVSAQTGTTGDFLESWDLDTVRDPALNDGLRIAAGALTLSL